tara:strand:- start:857 stop:1093 length:237 start_codon:yes stop_codon:yes gene_type:complete
VEVECGGSIVIFDYEYTKADTTLHLRDMRSGPSSAQQRTHRVVLGQVDRLLTGGIRHLEERLGVERSEISDIGGGELE